MKTIPSDINEVQIPIAAITGTNGKTTTSRMVAHIWKLSGKTVGLTTTDGIYIDGSMTFEGDTTGPRSAKMVLNNPLVEVAVLETARGGLLRSGIGYKYCNVGACLNVTADHLGLAGINSLEDLAKIKRMVVESARDTAVLNADDIECQKMPPFITASNILYVTMEQDNQLVKEHIRLGGGAVVLEKHLNGAMIVIHDKNQEKQVLYASLIPATINGLAMHNVQNAMFAVAICYSMGMSLENIKNGLLTFKTDFSQVPGRLNIYDEYSFKVLMDYAHNPAALKVIGELAQKMEVKGKRTLFLSAPGDRRDEDIMEFGVIAAKYFDNYIIKQDDELRGRNSGDVAKLLKQSLIDNGIKDENIIVILDEVAGIDYALQNAVDGDLVVLLADKIKRSWDQVINFKQVAATKKPDISDTRLMGPSIYFNDTGAVLDIILFGKDIEYIPEIIKLWEIELKRVMYALNLLEYKTGIRIYSQGFKYAVSFPPDLLNCGMSILCQVWASVYNKYINGEFDPLQKILDTIEPEIRQELNLKYREICKEASKRSLNVFLNKSNICIGSGKYGFRANINNISLKDIPWDDIKEVPSVLVTGTNGKTTTVRMTAYIASLIGKTVGYCSTDWVMIGDKVVEEGDLSGPAGSLEVMTNPDVEIAVLEVARGGLVRRGIIANYVKGSTVVNISEDHMGQDGIENLSSMAETKSLVYKAVENSGYSIINLDDKEIGKIVDKVQGRKIFITKRTLSEISPYIKDTEHICFIKDNAFYWKTLEHEFMIATFADTPITVNGKALHNIENAMNAICLSYVLGFTWEEIAKGLKTYENTAQNNRGRTNVFRYSGGTIILDFAHNPSAIGAILDMGRTYLGDNSKLYMLLGNTGDRVELTDGICQKAIDYNVDVVLIKELPQYLRGAKLGELTQKIETTLLKKGMKKDQLIMIGSEEEALAYTFKALKLGDVCVFLCHSSTAKILEELNNRTELI